jgi:hypothetical protein
MLICMATKKAGIPRPAKASGELKIGDVFDKHRDPLRNLETIVKIFDNSAASIWTEFEEFVITEQLLEHIHQFYTDFSKVSGFDAPMMPFWLEGFYGSGKSHLSKVLGHVLQNSEITDPDGTSYNAIDFFIEHTLKPTSFEKEYHQKLKAELIEGLGLFTKQFNVKTIFINLAPESKTETKAKEYLESFTKALHKAFNQFMGFPGIIETAELEKSLIQDGLLDQFKVMVEQEKEKSWEEIRDNTPLARQVFVNVYSQLMNIDIIYAQEYQKGVDIQSKQRDITSILTELNEYAKNVLSNPEEGIVGKILIVLDEAGLYFSAKESRIGEMMSAAEWINNPQNESRLNMIFSAQQNIKTYFENVKTSIDYRTAEQRFKHWQLDRNNIKTVVVRRWLKKDEGDRSKPLEKLLDDKFHALMDGTVFDTWKDPNQEYIRPTRDELFDTYPFLPYQFPLMISVTQKLISEKKVEEQYGGKTRSILQMTRDVLNNTLPKSGKAHFIDEHLGTFVTLSQLYETITFTVKSKDEDQFRLVENTDKLVEDEPTFLKEEKVLRFSFKDVARTVLLLKYVEEVYANEENIIRALFYSVDVPVTLVAQKVRKLITRLKKAGYLVFKKRKVEDKEGNVKDFEEFEIPSKDEREYIERTQHMVVEEKEVQTWLKNFFKDKEGGGVELLSFKDQMYLPSLKGPGDSTIDLDNAIRVKLDWQLDPDLEKVKVPDAQGTAMICVLTPRTLEKYKDSIQKLKVAIQKLVLQSANAKKLMIVITPNLQRPASDIARSADVLVKSIEDCIKFTNVIKQINTPNSGELELKFHKYVTNSAKDVLKLLQDDFDGGLIFSARENVSLEKAQLSDEQDENTPKAKNSFITDELVPVVTDAYSKVNPYAYLGQMKPTKEEIAFILKWDPKKASKVPGPFKKGTKSATTSIPVFIVTDDILELVPHQAEQYNHVMLKFKEYLEHHPDVDFVPGGHLLDTFDGAPFSWNEQVLLATIAAILRSGEWDVIQGGSVRNTTDKELLEAFSDVKGSYERFRGLRFKVAELVSQDDLTEAAGLLRDLFSEHVSQIGREVIDASIKRVLAEMVTLFDENVDNLKDFPFGATIAASVSGLKDEIDRALQTDRIVSRIKAFIEIFQKIASDAEKKDELDRAKQLLYRIRDLKDAGLLDRYQELNEFLSTTFTNWLNTQSSPESKEELDNVKNRVLELLGSPDVLSEEGWNDAWEIAKQSWDGYWTSYIKLHGKLITDIQQAMASIDEAVARTGTTKKINKKQLTSIFTCKEEVVMPDDVLVAKAFTCSKCKSDYNGLRVHEVAIQDNMNAILMDISPPVGPIPPIGRGGGKKGSIPEPTGPSAEELDSWESYIKMHGDLERIHTDIKNQRTLQAGSTDILAKINDVLSEFKDSYPSFMTGHSCSEEPVAWEIKSQACKKCKIPYMDLVDVAASLDTAYSELLEQLRELQDQMLAQTFEVIVDIGDDVPAIAGKMQDELGVIATILSTLKQIEPEGTKKLKITIGLEKVE